MGKLEMVAVRERLDLVASPVAAALAASVIRTDRESRGGIEDGV